MNTYYIPIGVSCSTASYLRQIGYRKEAFPFDWNVVPIRSAIRCIENNFNDFLSFDNLIFLEPTNRLLFTEDGENVVETKEIITPVYDKKYNILFVHDFSKKGVDDYASVREKYDKRIKRLKKYLSDENIKLIFIYKNTLPNEWQDLQYKKVNFKFRINHDENFYIDRINTQFISLQKFKRKTIHIRIYRSIEKKLINHLRDFVAKINK